MLHYYVHKNGEQGRKNRNVQSEQSEIIYRKKIRRTGDTINQEGRIRDGELVRICCVGRMYTLNGRTQLQLY